MKILFSPFSPYVRKCLVTAHELGLGDRVQLLPSNAHPVQRDKEIIAERGEEADLLIRLQRPASRDGGDRHRDHSSGPDHRPEEVERVENVAKQRVP